MKAMNNSPQSHRQAFRSRLMVLMMAACLLAGLAVGSPTQEVQAATLLQANFNSDTDGFVYQDDPFGTSQPNYASGSRVTGASCYGGSGGCLSVTLGGVDGNDILGMSGGWKYDLTLSNAESGVVLSFRYKLDQTAKYEYDEYSRIQVTVDGVLYGRGTKSYVDHLGGDGDSDSGSGGSSAGNSNTFLPTTDWQRHEIYLGELTAGTHTIILGAYNNKKTDSNESTTGAIDDVMVSNGNAAPGITDAQTLVNRVDINQFLAYNQGVAQFDDRCRGSGLGCSSSDYSTNYFNALTWVEQTLQALGYTTVRQNFNYSGNAGTNLYATKVGTTDPTSMYMLSAHLDGRGGGDAFDDDGSGVALVMEVARVLAGADVTTDKSVRFLFWDKEELGLYGSRGYVQDRRLLQGTMDEPTWLGLITHDMILYDHGAGTAGTEQSVYADLDVEWRSGTAQAAASRELAMKWRYLAGTYMSDYPANAYDYSTNTDDTSFHPYVASISVRENRRSITSGTNAEWVNPYYHKTTDLETSYMRDDDGDGKRDDIELGYNAVQATLGLVAELAGAHIVSPNQPPVANGQAVEVDEDGSVAITLSGTDPEGQVLSYSVVTNPGHGTLTGSGAMLSYTPAPDYHGTDSFSFKVNDGVHDSAPAVVAITVNPINDAPTAQGVTVITDEDVSVSLTLLGSDVDGDPLTYHFVSAPSHGALTGSAPNLTYTPSENYHGSDTFAYYVSDGALSSANAAVSITINSVNDVPMAFPQSLETPLNTPLSISLSGWDVETASLTFNIVTQPSHGNLSGSAPELTYTPASGYVGADGFTFTVSDGTAVSAPAAVSIMVGEVVYQLPFSDDFETDKGWNGNPDGSDTSKSGQWERGNPEGTDESGPKQLDATTSGLTNLVTGKFAGNRPNKYDVDKLTRILSPAVQLPNGQEILLSFNYYFAHGRNATSEDYFKVQVIGDTTKTVLEVRGSRMDVDAVWRTANLNLSEFAGQRVRILIIAADLGRDSLVEAAVDDLSITASMQSSLLISANFDTDEDGFVYQDDAFRGTNQAAYANGMRANSGCKSGGCLRVVMGGIDNEIILGISGGWTRSFTLASASDVRISFWYHLSQSPDYDLDEFSQMLVSLDGVLFGQGMSDYVLQINGNGNGGSAEASGWQQFTFFLTDLPAGVYQLTIGGYNNQKSYQNESTEALIDQVVVEIP